MIDARHCQADDVSRCKGPWPTLTVGSDPNAIRAGRDRPADRHGLRSQRDDNTVAVFNGATCNATTSAGCGQTPATVPVGMVPVAIFADPANHTVYVPDGGRGRRLDARQRDLQRDRSRRLPDHAPADRHRRRLRDRRRRGPGDPHGLRDRVRGPPTSDVRPEPTACRCSTRTPATRPCNRAAAARRLTRTGDRRPYGAQVDPANHTLYTANCDNTDLSVRPAPLQRRRPRRLRHRHARHRDPCRAPGFEARCGSPSTPPTTACT